MPWTSCAKWMVRDENDAELIFEADARNLLVAFTDA